MTNNIDDSAALITQVESAIAQQQQLGIIGGKTKVNESQLAGLTVIDTTQHKGIVEYHPTELVLTARAGTRLSDISLLLNENNQHLPFEPPEYNGQATLGGTIACAMAGPRRPWSGSARDHVLGCRIISGNGKLLQFGGQVMKNVAGYDVSRLMTGSYGCLGLITEVSIKVMPKPESNATLLLNIDRSNALQSFIRWRQQGMPISAWLHDGDNLFLRLEGSEHSVSATKQQIGGDPTTPDIWTKLREMELPFFHGDQALWRLSVPMGTLLNPLPGPSLMDWAGAQWWIKTDASSQQMQDLAKNLGGHAVGYPKSGQATIRQSPHPSIMQLNKRLKQQLDPRQLFNPGMLYAGL
jgi:glycolate oxidase FAD binding subunit